MIRTDELHLGGIVGLAGALVLLISVFLPAVESDQFLRVADNTLIQQSAGWIVVLLALGTAGASFRGLYGERAIAMGALGILAIVCSFAFGNSDDLMTLSSAEGGLFARTEYATPGVGIYAVGVGGLLALVGGLMVGDGRRN